MPKETATSSLRELNHLMRDLDIIIEDCGGDTAQNIEKAKLDEFQYAKLDLGDLLTTIKSDIKTLQNLEERLGEKNQESIRLKYKIEGAFENAKKNLAKMEDLIKKDRSRIESGKKRCIGSR